MEIFTYEALDVAGVAWDSLRSDHVVWATDPVLGETAQVTENLLILVD